MYDYEKQAFPFTEKLIKKGTTFGYLLGSIGFLGDYILPYPSNNDGIALKINFENFSNILPYFSISNLSNT